MQRMHETKAIDEHFDVMKICLHCKEEILASEVFANGQLHQECMFRCVAGSVSCQQRICKTGGKCGDDPNLSARENAKASLEYYRLQERRKTKARFN